MKIITVRVKKPIFVGATIEKGEILNIDEDIYNAFGEEYLEIVEPTEGNDKDGNTGRIEEPPSNSRRQVRSKTKRTS